MEECRRRNAKMVLMISLRIIALHESHDIGVSHDACCKHKMQSMAVPQHDARFETRIMMVADRDVSASRRNCWSSSVPLLISSSACTKVTYLLRLSTPRTSSVRRGILTTLNSSYSSSIWSRYFFCIFLREVHCLHSLDFSGKSNWLTTMQCVSM